MWITKQTYNDLPVEYSAVPVAVFADTRHVKADRLKAIFEANKDAERFVNRNKRSETIEKKES